MTTVNQINKWLERLTYIYLVNDNLNLKISTKNNRMGKPVAHTFENNGLQRGLNAYKKKLVQLENEVKRTFRFPKNIVNIINNYWKEKGSFGYYGKAIYIEGRNDIKMDYGD